MRKKLFAFLFAIVACVGIANAGIYSGTCGGNLTWTLNTEDSTLVIAGTGDMNDYGWSSFPWYNYKSAVKYVTLPAGITSIGDYAFYECASLKSINIPNGVVRIGSAAFYRCSALPSIAIPNSVTSIGSSAFYYCTSLSSVSLSNNITTIENATFSDCKAMHSINIPNGVVKIGASAFERSGLTSISIPSSVLEIERLAFSGTPYVQDANNWEGDSYNSRYMYVDNCLLYGSYQSGDFAVKSGTRVIADVAFGGSSVTSITLPSSLRTIGKFSFSSCTYLQNIIIPASVVTINEGCFYNCSQLTTVSLPNTLQSIGEKAFCECSSLTKINLPSSLQEIGKDAFRKCPELTLSIVIPEGITHLNFGVFAECSKLSSVTLPSTLTHIGQAAFNKCSNLQHIILPEGVRVIEASAFANSGLLAVNLPQTLDSLLGHSFEGCPITEITIPENLKYIYGGEFYDCKQLRSVQWDAKHCVTTNIGLNPNVFHSDTITSLRFGEHVQFIPDYFFEYTTLIMDTLDLTDSIETIGQNAFSNAHVSTVKIPKNLTNLKHVAFGNCYELKNIIWNARQGSDLYYGSWDNDQFLHIRDSIRSITFGDEVNYIPANLCVGMTNLEGPVTIPESVTSIGAQAFLNCDKVTHFIDLATTPQTVIYTSFNDYMSVDTVSLQVPCGAENAYRSSEFGTRFFKHIYSLSYSINVESADPTQGSVVLDTICEDNSIELTAIPLEGYRFKEWSDGNTDNPRVLPLVQDITLSALFEQNSSTKADRIDISSSAQKMLLNNQILILRGDHTYTIDGQLLK